MEAGCHRNKWKDASITTAQEEGRGRVRRATVSRATPLSAATGAASNVCSEESDAEDVYLEAWGALYMDDAGIVSHSPGKLANIVEVVVKVCTVLGLAGYEAKMETMRLHESDSPTVIFNLTGAAKCTSKQTNKQEKYLDRTTTNTPDVCVEIARRVQRV